jgi:hypothetical protein
VHRDLKPANVLIDDKTVKLADFGIGGVVAKQAARDSRIGTVAASQLSLAEQLSLYRGAGTPLYMSPEQRRGEAPDPRHDLHCLGVLWYQLLVGDFTREMHHGWARELETKFATPRKLIEIIQRCVGLFEERPRDAGEVLRELQTLLTAPVNEETPADAVSDQEPERFRRIRLARSVQQLQACHTAAVASLGSASAQFWAGAAAGFVVPLMCYLMLCPLWSDLHIGIKEGLIASGIIGLVAGLGGVVHWRGLPKRKADLEAKIEEMLREFPQECKAWGGVAALRDADIVREIVRDKERLGELDPSGSSETPPKEGGS